MNNRTRERNRQYEARERKRYARDKARYYREVKRMESKKEMHARVANGRSYDACVHFLRRLGLY